MEPDDYKPFWWVTSPPDAPTERIPVEELNRLAIEQYEESGGNE